MTEAFLAYGRQQIEDDDIAAVAEALRSDYLTTGPRVEAFENAFAEAVGAPHAVVCSNGTAALHMAMIALGVGPGDVCIAPAITFVATSNAARFEGADVVFADVDPVNGLMTPETLERAIALAGERYPGRPIKAVLPVHLAGRAVDMPGIRALADSVGAQVVEDACHAVGTAVTFDGQRSMVGACDRSAMAVFSFHPVKTIASGEGGMVTTRDAAMAQKLRYARAHGLTRDPKAFQRPDAAFDGGVANPWYYEQVELGYNYRLPDVLCALGQSQLSKLPRFSQRRAELAARYDHLMPHLGELVSTVPALEWCEPTLHLYVSLIDFDKAGLSRREVMERLKAKGVGSQVHYGPVPDQPYYLDLYGAQDIPGARAYYERTLSLPFYPAMQDQDVDRVVQALAEVLGLQI